MERYWDLIEQIVRESDIILEVIDARFPQLSRNKQVEELLVKLGRPVIIVMNKADLISRKDLEVNVAELTKEFDDKERKTEIVYISNRQTRTVKTLLAKIRQVFAKYGKRPDFYNQPIIKKPYREAKGDIVVGIVGYPNVGKSSIINALSFKKKVAVSKKAGTTHGIHWIKANNEIKLIDTPGVIPLEYEEESKLAMIAAKSLEKIHDPQVVAIKIIESFMVKNNVSKIFEFYNLKEQKSEYDKNALEILTELSLGMKHLRKGGVADENRTSYVIIKDWQDGNLRL